MDDLLIYDTVFGKVPFWKSLIHNSAKLRNVVERADAAGKTTLRDEEKAPRLVADKDKPPPEWPKLSADDIEGLTGSSVWLVGHNMLTYLSVCGLIRRLTEPLSCRFGPT
jgi:hypothetical protein